MKSRPVLRKLALLTADYPPDIWSGIGVAVHRQAMDLAALGAQVHVIVGRPNLAVTESENPKVLALAGNSVPVDFDSFDSDGWVHLHSLPLAELALGLRRKHGVKLAYTVHTQPWLELAAHPPQRFWLDTQTRLLSACDQVVFLSAAEAVAAQALFPSLPPIHVIPNGVSRPPADLPGRHERNVVVFAGRFAVSKGVILLEQCIRRVRQKSDLRFLIAGGHGDSEGTAAIGRIAREHSVCCEVVDWLSRSDLDDRLARSQLVLVPSRYEPCGLIALEAMRMGAPVLAASVGGLREIVGPGSGGLLLNSSEPQDWADETIRIIRDTKLWTKLHQQGPAFVDCHYRSSHMASRLLREVYT